MRAAVVVVIIVLVLYVFVGLGLLVGLVGRIRNWGRIRVGRTVVEPRLLAGLLGLLLVQELQEPIRELLKLCLVLVMAP